MPLTSDKPPVSHPPDYVEAMSGESTSGSTYGYSDYESAGGGTATTSVTSAIFDYKYENGRRYHSYREGKYVIPNDETEQERLDIIHHIYLMLLNGNITNVPLENPHRILDVGTGTGIWAIDCADTYPSAEVIGTDISAIQPTWVPPNCKFEIDDAEHEWTYPKNYFDLVHSRHLAQSIKDWQCYLERIYAHLKPGGYVEIYEAELAGLYSDDNTYRPDSNIHKWMQHYCEACKLMGIPDPCTHLEKWVKEVGFEEVTVRKYKTPWGPWAKDKKLREIGRFMMLNCETAFEAYGLALLTRYCGKMAEEAKSLCEGARADVFNRNIHIYNYQWCVIGRKPE